MQSFLRRQISQAEEKAAERVEREASEVYAAVRPDGGEAAWAKDIPELRPTLRPYQSRALHWMVQRERAAEVWAVLRCCNFIKRSGISNNHRCCQICQVSSSTFELLGCTASSQYRSCCLPITIVLMGVNSAAPDCR